MPDDIGKKEMPAFFIQDKDTNFHNLSIFKSNEGDKDISKSQIQ